MKDYEIIAHQARKIAELEVKVTRGLESERQLLAVLQSAGIEVTEIELNHEEVEFLRLYRNATPEGKAMIKAKVEAMAEKAGMSPANKEDLVHVPPSQGILVRNTTKSNRANSEPVSADFPGLPKDFFKRSSE